MTSPHSQHPGQAAAAARPAGLVGPVDPDGTWPLDIPGGPCRTWPLQTDCRSLPGRPQDWDQQQRFAVEAATEILWRSTAGRVGLCREMIRPCRQNHAEHQMRHQHGSGGPYPTLVGGRWVNLHCGCPSPNTCGCGPVPELLLPGRVHREPPTYEIQVWIDGVALPVNAYTLFDDSRLVRVDGGQWPDCQRLDKPIFPAPGDPESAAETFGIIYWRGTPVPPAGRRAVSLLAGELWKACSGKDCQIPVRVQSIEREGVNYQRIDPQEFLTRGWIGITEIDLWIGAMNRHGRQSPSEVHSVDMPEYRSQRTWGSYR